MPERGWRTSRGFAADESERSKVELPRSYIWAIRSVWHPAICPSREHLAAPAGGIGQKIKALAGLTEVTCRATLALEELHLNNAGGSLHAD